MVTGKLPKALEDRPKRTPILAQYLSAFSFLREFRSERDFIELSDIFLYAKEIGEEPIEFAKIISTANRKFSEALREDKTIK